MRDRAALLEALRRSGAIRSRGVETAFRSVDPASMIPEPFRPLAAADSPIPYTMDVAAVTPSPEALGVMLEALEIEPGVRVAVVGGGAYPAALASVVAGDAPVLLVEPDDRVREVLASALLEHTKVRVEPDLDGSWDRVWFPMPEVSTVVLPERLADMGFAVARTETPAGPALLKRIRSGSEFVELTTDAIPAGPGGRPFNVRRCLALDGLMVRAWQGRVHGREDEHFATSVSETLEGGPLDSQVSGGLPAKAAARKAFHVAFILQSAGDLDRALDMYERSVALHPSAEAHTFLGWTHSFEGHYDAAIEACRRAIEVDPTFGNPYNDIGAYLLEQGRPEESIPWLEKAFSAPRYCCPFYAHTNLARAYISVGRSQQARRHLLEALKANPDYEPARDMLRRIDPAFDYFA